jgi:trk system potassium uptake protein TrkH
VKRIVRVVSNLGFLLQITGLLLVLPIAIGLQATPTETGAVASLTATCFLSFGVGFVLNSLCERKELDEKTSLWIMIIVFTLLPMVLMIPYIWNNVFASGNPIDLFTNAYFETVSGFTTTGFTFIATPEALPTSLLFYRSLVEFIGGIGFIYIIAAFLYPSQSLDAYAETFGVDKLSKNLKKVFLSVMLIYTFFVAIFTVIFYFLYQPNGSPDIIIASTAAIDVLTGGYQPNITAGISIFQISIIFLMLLGSLNFCFHYNLFRMKLRSLLTPEIKLYLEIIAGATVLMAILAWINPFDSLFHVVSMLSSTGIDYINIASTSVPAKIVFILIGLVGGCAFSMAGGIRIQRIRVLIDALRKKSHQPDREELKAVLTFIASFFIVLFILSLIFSTIGISLLDSVFEVGSALTTNGISMGITTAVMPLGYKWLLILAMIVGRIEIIAAFKALEGTKIFETAKRLVERVWKRKRRKASFTVDS